MVAVLATALLTGTLIGCVGIGGVLLAPLLVLFAGQELSHAMAIASFSFLFTGVTGTLSYAKHRSIDWDLTRRLALAIVPTAALGALVNTRLNGSVLTLVLAALTLFAGVNVLAQRRRDRPARQGLSPRQTLLIGSGVGFGSALTGTGGPVLLMPVLMILRLPVLSALGASQLIQLPLALSASLSFWLLGNLNVSLGVAIGVVQAVGALLGSSLAHKVDQNTLRLGVAIMLVVTALYLLARCFSSWSG